jgi:predicted adenine nucleotide alpha hydrolase (AANH) superfamily ATPase
MKALLHICCGPCAIYPVQALRAEGIEVEGFFYNPNIHPYAEYERRYAAVVEASSRLGLDVLYHRYDDEDFLRKVCAVPDREGQHLLCWRIRLQETARVAQVHGIPQFTTTLLSSPYQDVKAIADLGEAIARERGLTFLARNFRRGFSESHKLSKEWQLYHQNYCGCLFSEKESVAQRQKRKKEA